MILKIILKNNTKYLDVCRAIFWADRVKILCNDGGAWDVVEGNITLYGSDMVSLETRNLLYVD